MKTDLKEYREKLITGYDYCIIGTGPAGITLANELKSGDRKIALVESGLFKKSDYADKLRRVSGEGIYIKPNSRERVVGGASTTWSGASSFLDEIDMAPREGMKYSGWPIVRKDLLPFYGRAIQDYRFPASELFDERYLDELKKEGEWQVKWENLDEKVFWAPKKVQNFGSEFKDLFDSNDVDLFMDATLLELISDKSEPRVSRGILQTSTGKKVDIHAAIFIVATGAIENARILLKSRSGFNKGLGNENDQVGRYMMNHPKGNHGFIKLNKPIKELPHYFGCIKNGYAGCAGIRLKESVQRKEGVLNSYVRLVPHYRWSDSRGVELFIGYLIGMKTLFNIWMRTKKDKTVSLKDYSETGDDVVESNDGNQLLTFMANVWAIMIDLPNVSRYLYARLFQSGSPKIKIIQLRNFMEMEPHPENRVLLDDSENDIYGQPIARVVHKTTKLDKHSLVTLHEYVKREFEEKKLGHLESDLLEGYWPVNTEASHHMGTTRMGSDPKTSVVDSNCKLHSVENVYIAGSSVFPTSGCTNPTFTIVALAIRLAEHLKSKVL
jgi:choline dehydrogenase-like flavoprotein